MNKLLALAATGAACLTLTTTAVGTASAQATIERATVPVAVRAAPAAVNTVKVNVALLRKEPDTPITKLDAAETGQGIDLLCWVAPTGSAGYIWFRTHPWSSRFGGGCTWM